MTQVDKNLLIKDLCGRLPYKVKIETLDGPQEFDIKWLSINMCNIASPYLPYLYPLSSMTEEQYDEMEKLVSEDYLENIQVTKEMREKVEFITHWPLYSPKVIDWFNKNHFDYRGLIPMCLAIDCTNLNIY